MKEVLSALQEDGVLSDLKAGANGAPQLSSDQLSQLQQLAQLVTPDREIKEKGSFDKQVNNSAEHLLYLADKKVMMLLIVKKDKILFYRYLYCRVELLLEQLIQNLPL